MLELATFGAPERHYSGAVPSAGGEASKCLRDLRHLLLQHDPELPDKVERAFNHWNNILRDYLRNETGLRLSVGEDKRAVPVRIDGGLPLPFQQEIEDFVNPEILSLYLQRTTVAASARGLRLIELEYQDIISWLNSGTTLALKNEVEHCRALFQSLDERLAELDHIKRIGKIQEDILGAYFFRVPEIRLYWMVIGLLAGVLQVSVEALTFVVAAHELAHAYTHLGRDIDGQRWETEAFAQTEMGIIEGLAQFYAGSVCDRVKDRFPSAKKAYEALLALQTGAYQVHTKWGGTDSAGEVVRFTMIETRSRPMSRYVDFQRELEHIRKQAARDAGTPGKTTRSDHVTT